MLCEKLWIHYYTIYYMNENRNVNPSLEMENMLNFLNSSEYFNSISEEFILYYLDLLDLNLKACKSKVKNSYFKIRTSLTEQKYGTYFN